MWAQLLNKRQYRQGSNNINILTFVKKLFLSKIGGGKGGWGLKGERLENWDIANRNLTPPLSLLTLENNITWMLKYRERRNLIDTMKRILATSPTPLQKILDLFRGFQVTK